MGKPLGVPAAIVRWLRGRRTGPKEPTTPAIPVARFQNICISREAGAGGGAIARMTATRLDWKVYDHEILEAIAQLTGEILTTHHDDPTAVA